MGAVATGVRRVLNCEIVDCCGFPIASSKRSRHKRPPSSSGASCAAAMATTGNPRAQLDPVDDGLATGGTMRAAIRALRQQQPAQIVVAVPTASLDTCEALKREADDVVCAMTPEPFLAVGRSEHQDFTQTTDDASSSAPMAAAENGRRRCGPMI